MCPGQCSVINVLTELPGGRTLLSSLDHNGMTPLMYAARVGQKEALHLLLSSQAGLRTLNLTDRYVCMYMYVCSCWLTRENKQSMKVWSRYDVFALSKITVWTPASGNSEDGEALSRFLFIVPICTKTHSVSFLMTGKACILCIMLLMFVQKTGLVTPHLTTRWRTDSMSACRYLVWCHVFKKKIIMSSGLGRCSSSKSCCTQWHYSLLMSAPGTKQVLRAWFFVVYQQESVIIVFITLQNQSAPSQMTNQQESVSYSKTLCHIAVISSSYLRSLTLTSSLLFVAGFDDSIKLIEPRKCRIYSILCMITEGRMQMGKILLETRFLGNKLLLLVGVWVIIYYCWSV